jgi:hypothetical protein
MSMPLSHSYPLTETGFDALRTKLLALGVTIPAGTRGTVSGVRDILLGYDFTGALLTITILKKPVLIPAGEVWKVVDQWVAG